MIVRLDRFWRRRSGEHEQHPSPLALTPLEAHLDANPPDPTSGEDSGPEPPLPEQPAPLPPIPGAPRPRSGVLVPVRASRSRLALGAARVSKRAVLAVGVCAGLAAPVLTRHLATRALTSLLGAGGGPGASVGRWQTTTVEIIRVTSGSNRPGEAAATVGKILEQLKR